MNTNDKALILIVDDEQQMRAAMETVIGRMGHSIVQAANGKEALERLESSKVDLIISDLKMPELTGDQLLSQVKEKYPQIPFVMITAYGTIDQAVLAMKEGAFDFITKPFSAEDLERAINRAVSPSNSQLKPKAEKSAKSKSIAIVTNDPAFKRILEIATTIARSTASVLVQGESGTGKELIARLIHTASDRADKPFVAVNCAALPENLLESELFGHERGSFTGAVGTKVGKFEQANGGTMLLDEISEMDPILQAKLLRVLQEREIDRVGGLKPIPIDVRVVATTNRDLKESVAKGEFREDLYYRLNVVPLFVPPLRDRQGDLKLLVDHFVRSYSNGAIKNVPDNVYAVLAEHRWPGNVRELQNATERAILLASGGELKAEYFLLGSLGNSLVSGEVQSELQLHPGMSVAEAEKRLIFETLRATGNNKTRAAELLGISIRTLRNKLHEYGSDVSDMPA